jgi:RNA-binding protein YhbY
MGMSDGDDQKTPALGPPPAATGRRELLGRGHALKAHLLVGRAGLSDPLLAQVRQAFINTDLLKVRLDADSADQADALAADLAARVPCHLIRRIGRVALLYHPGWEKTP